MAGFESDFITIGKYVISRSAILWADTAYGWRDEVRRYERSANGIATYVSSTYRDRTGVKIVLADGNSLIFPDEYQETSKLRKWLVGNALPEEREPDNTFGLPPDLAKLFVLKGE